jgi:hypothetical protein
MTSVLYVRRAVIEDDSLIWTSSKVDIILERAKYKLVLQPSVQTSYIEFN